MRLALLLLLGVLLFPAGAQAHHLRSELPYKVVPQARSANHGTLNDPVTTRSLQVAARFFGQAGVGCSHVALGVPPEPYDHEGVAWGQQPGCQIWTSIPPPSLIDPHAVYEERAEGEAERGLVAQYCAIIMHEYGHNLGLVHTVGHMWPMDTDELYIHPVCWPSYCAWHIHRHVHRRKGKKRVHRHRHCHLKVGQP